MTLIPQYHIVDHNKTYVRRLGMRILFTDGSYDNGVSGWAVVEEEDCISQGWRRGGTSNLAEGEAILAALRAVGDSPALIFTDALAWVRAFNREGSFKKAEAKEVLSHALDIYHPTKHTVEWIPSHTGRILGNELADSYAKQARCLKDAQPIAC